MKFTSTLGSAWGLGFGVWAWVLHRFCQPNLSEIDELCFVLAAGWSREFPRLLTGLRGVCVICAQVRDNCGK